MAQMAQGPGPMAMGLGLGPGFAGWEAKLPNGAIVDIPLRMIEHVAGLSQQFQIF